SPTPVALPFIPGRPMSPWGPQPISRTWSGCWSTRWAGTEEMRRSYVVLLLLLSAIWGSSYMFIKVGVRDFSPAALVELRLLLARAVLVPLVAVLRRLGAVRRAFAPA